VTVQPVLIAQISDLHVKRPGELAFDGIDTAAAVVRCVQALNRLAPRPALVVISGDLADTAMADEYEHLRHLLAPLEIPLALVPGNHDARAPLCAAFPEQRYAEGSGALNLALELARLDIVLLDSSVPGKPHGELDADTLSWLDAHLAISRTRPALLFLHHPPFLTGIRHMDDQNLRNAEALAAVLRRHPRVRLVAAGHVHRAALTLFAGVAATICPAPNLAVALDLGESRPPSLEWRRRFHLHAWFCQSLATWSPILFRSAARGSASVLWTEMRRRRQRTPGLSRLRWARAGASATTPLKMRDRA
jgi:3',5'-cyclic AMP phosphodiesterase CpdA